MKIKNFSGHYGFLSNFYVEKNGKTAEHYFQASKTHDRKWQDLVKLQHSPEAAKKFGRSLPLRKDWQSVKVEIMRIVLERKFSDPELKQKLLETGNRELVEGNTWHDNFWGDCKCHKCRHIKGRNVLGILLMKVRDMLRSFEEAE